jgi:sigma-B regulation protein RsbU (phosphoserine phosphatase)
MTKSTALRSDSAPARIAATDRKLVATLEALRTGATFVTCAPGDLDSLVGKVDIFLLDDDTAIRFLGSRSENTWPSVVVTAPEEGSVPAAFRQGIVDDLLSLPPRAIDVERMIRGHALMRALHELEESSHGVGELVRRLQEDIRLAQKVQRRLIREKFPALGPLSVKSKYWCGLKSGGDYFDVFELPGGTHAGVILADSSSYALSTALIGSLVHFSVHVGREDYTEPGRVVSALLAKLRETMKEKDKLSLFYGILDRKTFELRFVSFGGVFLGRRSKEGAVEWISRGENPALGATGGGVPAAGSVMLVPGDRLVACSDGWGTALGGDSASVVGAALSGAGDAQELLNDLAFRLRRKLESESDEPVNAESEFPMPPEDCSVLVFDLAQGTLRLAK